jgi:hypothetical protein
VTYERGLADCVTANMAALAQSNLFGIEKRKQAKVELANHRASVLLLKCTLHNFFRKSGAVSKQFSVYNCFIQIYEKLKLFRRIYNCSKLN